MPRRPWQTALQNQRISMGLCTICEGPLKSKRYCEKCLAHTKELKERRSRGEISLDSIHWNEGPVEQLISDLAYEARFNDR